MSAFPRVALIHDYLAQNGGAERVLKAMQNIWPEAPTYTLFYDARLLPAFKGHELRTSFLQHAPFVQTKYQWYLALMPAATESYDLSAFDIVISNCSAFSKGVITRPDALHVSYCHTPTRYLWSDTHSYIRELPIPAPIKWILPPVLSSLRVWDREASERVDRFVANSQTVAKRIWKYYRRESHVIHPPIDTNLFSVRTAPKDYYLTGGRLVPYKRFDLPIRACNRLKLPLKIFGTGPIEKELLSLAGPTIEFVGRVTDEKRSELFAGCKAFLHPQEEDFGITPVEAMASGRPVIAYGVGGTLETVVDGVTGAFFYEQNWETLADLLLRFDETVYDPEKIRAHALCFGAERFQNELHSFVENLWKTQAHAHLH